MDKFKKLAESMQMEFEKIELLKDCFNLTKIPTNKGNKSDKDNCKNSAGATIGDALLKTFLSIRLYEKHKDRGQITEDKQKLESDQRLAKVCEDFRLLEYTFNDSGDKWDNTRLDNRLPNNKKIKATIVEAILAAVYFDKGIAYTEEWFGKTKLFEEILEEIEKTNQMKINTFTTDVVS